MIFLATIAASYYLATTPPVGPMPRRDCEVLSQGTIGCVWQPKARRVRK